MVVEERREKGEWNLLRREKAEVEVGGDWLKLELKRREKERVRERTSPLATTVDKPITTTSRPLLLVRSLDQLIGDSFDF